MKCPSFCLTHSLNCQLTLDFTTPHPTTHISYGNAYPGYTMHLSVFPSKLIVLIFCHLAEYASKVACRHNEDTIKASLRLNWIAHCAIKSSTKPVILDTETFALFSLEPISCTVCYELHDHLTNTCRRPLSIHLKVFFS